MAFAYGVATFDGSSDSANFTWTPFPGNNALTSNPPKTFAPSPTPTDGSFVYATLAAPATNIGGTIQASAKFQGTVVILASD